MRPYVYMRKKVLVCSNVPPLIPSNTLWLFFRKIFFFFNIQRKCICYQLKRNIHKNTHVIKKKDTFDCKVFKLQRFSKVFPNVGGNALFWRVHSSKNLLKPGIRPQVFILSIFAYKLVNLLVSEKKKFKWARTEIL